MSIVACISPITSSHARTFIFLIPSPFFSLFIGGQLYSVCYLYHIILIHQSFIHFSCGNRYLTSETRFFPSEMLLIVHILFLLKPEYFLFEALLITHTCFLFETLFVNYAYILSFWNTLIILTFFPFEARFFMFFVAFEDRYSILLKCTYIR